MKRHILFVLLLVFAIVLTGCFPGVNPRITETDITETPPEPPTEITETDPPETTVTETVPPETKITCPNCQAEVAEGCLYCCKCGVELANAGGDEAAYAPTKIVKNTDDYVGILDVKLLTVEVPQGLELLDDLRPQDYTLYLKKRYRNENGDVIRLPYLKENSQLARDINQEIIDLGSNRPEERWDYDFDAFIYQDVLSIKILYDYEVIKTYNFDISTGQLQSLTVAELFNKLGIDKETVAGFLEVYARDYFWKHYNNMYDLSYDETYSKVETGISTIIADFNNAYDDNTLNIYKNVRNYSYGIYLNYAQEEYCHIEISLAPSEFEMALLSPPWETPGFYYRTLSEFDVPARDAYNNEIELHILNDASEGQPVYIVPYTENNNNYIELADVEFINLPNASDPSIIGEKLTPKNISLPQTNKSDIYLYYTALAEGMPSEAICMNNDFPSNYAQQTIHDDMAYGYSIEYIDDGLFIIDYNNLTGDNNCRLNIMSGRNFEATGDWQTLGIPITTGRFSFYDNKVALFPGQADIQNGADEYYIFEFTKHRELKYLRGSSSGPLDSDLTLSPTPIDMMFDPYY